MNYYSLNKQSPIASFKEATILGQAPDKGLYFPDCIPQLDKDLISNIENISNEEIAFRVIQPFIGTEIKEDELYRIVTETINFPIPLVPVTENISSLELFHGPTLAFKDIGARFMSRCLGYFVKEDREEASGKNSKKEKIIVLVATSGDTGGAVANGFYNVDGVEVVILYPSGKVSSVQEKQLTTLGKNIHALEVNGTFDDCQQMVKQAFTDEELNKQLFLTSANSINVARWLPQQFYYFFAYKQWKDSPLGVGGPPVISVPSGNFGNICAGILAHMSGLPVKHFIAACNANDVVPRFMQTDGSAPLTSFISTKAVATISNAMDVGNPSNFIRILELFHQQFPQLKEKFSSVSITDEETKETMKRVYDQFDYTLDPHGAVGFLALERYLNGGPQVAKGMFLETAHPVKFYDVVEPVLNSKISIPESVQQIINLPKKAHWLENDYKELKSFLINKMY